MTKEVLKQARTEFLVRSVIWIVARGIIQLIGGRSIMASGKAGSVIMTLIYLASFVLFVVRPVVQFVKLNKEDAAVKRFKDARKKNLLLRQEQRDKCTVESDEVFAVRSQYANDIAACVKNYDESLDWSWVGVSSVNKVFIVEAEGEETHYHMASFTPNEENRVEALYASIHGKNVVMENRAYIQAKNIEKSKYDVPVSNFLFFTVGESTWQWIDRPSNTIAITFAGVQSAPATVTFGRDGTVDDITINGSEMSLSAWAKARTDASEGTAAPGRTPQKSYGNVVTVEPGEADEEPEPVCIQRIEDDRKAAEDYQSVLDALNADMPKPVDNTPEPTAIEMDDDTAGVAEYAPVDEDDCAPTEPKTFGKVVVLGEDNSSLPENELAALQKFCEEHGTSPEIDPDINDDVLENSARLIYEAEAMDISSAAMYAQSIGDDAFVMRWPEGIQSCKEAILFAKHVVSHAGFVKAEVKMDSQTIKFVLPIPDFD